MFPRLLESQTVKAQITKTITATDQNRITSPQAASYTFLRGRLAASGWSSTQLWVFASHRLSKAAATVTRIQALMQHVSRWSYHRLRRITSLDQLQMNYCCSVHINSLETPAVAITSWLCPSVFTLPSNSSSHHSSSKSPAWLFLL